MCGIAGIFNFNGKKAEQKDVERMVETIKYRGPNDRGFYAQKNIALGQCRLSILDLSGNGRQPLANEDNSLWIVFNGEIYNFIELRRELKSLGHVFRSHTDTEVILHAYEQWGEKCLPKFNGMWAFAIWDEKKRRLFCSRDRFGIKPFYFWHDEKIFAFASEIKALLELDLPRVVNPGLMYDFLADGILDHTDETFFKGIKKLTPASWIVVDERGGSKSDNFWDFDVSDCVHDPAVSFQSSADDLKGLLTDAVKIRLRSDVPVGSCLSGGLDSSSIVCLVSRLLEHENISSVGAIQKTFSSCFENRRFDERDYIEDVIGKTGAEKNFIFPDPGQYLSALDSIIWHQEEPFSGTGMAAQWFVMEGASKKVKILLDGQGSDELLCGYRKFYIFYLRKLIQNGHWTAACDEALRFFLSPQILKTTDFKSGLRYFKIGKTILGARELLAPGFSADFSNRTADFGYRRDLGKRIKEDITKWSLPVLLRYEDKNSMAHSLESRLPFLDYRVVEKIASFPLDEKMKNGWTKAVLREAMKGILPEPVRLRKSKLGFSTPEDEWLRGKLSTHMKETIEQAVFLPSYADSKKWRKAFDNYLNGHGTLTGEILSRFYIAELWGRKFILR